jgi:hypothetical protein
MVRVVNCYAQRVSKYGRGLSERNAMLSKIGPCLVLIPFEVYHIASMFSLLCEAAIGLSERLIAKSNDFKTNVLGF